MNYALQTVICPRVGTTECRSVGQNAGFNDLGHGFQPTPLKQRILRGASGLPKTTRGMKNRQGWSCLTVLKLWKFETSHLMYHQIKVEETGKRRVEKIWFWTDVFWKTDIQGDVNSTTYRVYANRGKKRKYSRAGISFRKEQKQL